MIERHIDFAVFSAVFRESDFWNEKYKPCNAPAFYKRGYEDAFGARFFFGNNKSNKAMVVWAGYTLSLFRDAGRQDPDMLAWALSLNGSFSRLDLAVTDFIEDDFITVGDTKKWYAEQLITSSLVAGGGKTISSYAWDFSEKPETFYVGDIKSRGKKGIFRAYDKSLDLGIGDEIITRIELELRGSNAQQTAKRLSQTDDIGGNFRAKFNVNSRDFDRLMDAPAVKIQRGLGLKKKDDDEKMESRWEWLMSQVAPSLKEARNYDIDNGLGNNRMYSFLKKAGMSHGAIKDVLEKFDDID